MTIQEVIDQLKVIQKQYGDLPVLGSSDEEQNSLGDVFEIQCGELTEYDEYTNSTVKVGDRVVVIVPAI
jgi:co-chaperonin GroES (HSP10)